MGAEPAYNYVRDHVHDLGVVAQRREQRQEKHVLGVEPKGKSRTLNAREYAVVATYTEDSRFIHYA